MSVSICIMGELLVEFLCKNYNHSFTRPGEFLGHYSSGTPAIFAAQVARLGFSSLLFGCGGNDDFGELNIERLCPEGVATEGITMVDKAPTGTAFVSYRTLLELDFIFNIPSSACGFLSPDHIQPALLSAASIFILWVRRCFRFALLTPCAK